MPASLTFRGVRPLEQGGARDAAQLVRDFLGREPRNDAFLRDIGLKA